MPLQRCTSDNKPAWRWGESGKAYPYTPGDKSGESKAKRRAIRQGLAIGGGTLQEKSLTPGGLHMTESEIQEQSLVNLRESLLCLSFQEGVTERVDRKAGLVRGVKVHGRLSANKRYYTDKAQDNIASFVEGLQVGIDHIDPATKRRTTEYNGFLANPRKDKTGDNIYADWRYNPAHPLTEQILWDAENNPSARGFSIDARGRTSPSPEYGTIVEEVVRLRSADLVSDPATNSTLFESCDPPVPADQRGKPVVPSSAGDKGETIMEWKDLTLDDLRKNRADLVEAVVDESDALQLIEQRDTELAALREQLDTAKTTAATEIAALQAKVDGFETEKKLAQTETEIREDLEKVGLVGIHAPSETFLTLLREAKDRPARQAIIKDRTDTIDRITKPHVDLPGSIVFCESRQQTSGAVARPANITERVQSWRE